MSDQSDFNDKVFKDKLETLLNEENVIKKWNEGILIKSLILLPIIIYFIGLFIVNKPENLTEILTVILFPLAFILIGLIILFAMRIKLN